MATAVGKITTTAITQQTRVRILVTQDPDTGAIDYATRKTGAVAVTVTGFDMVDGGRQRRYRLKTDVGTMVSSCSGAQTHWLARDKDTLAVEIGPEGRPYKVDGEWLTEAEYAQHLRDVGAFSDEDWAAYNAGQPGTEKSDPERPISGHRPVHALPLDNSADNAERGAAEGAEWAATLSAAELRQAIDAREATLEPCPYNDAYTAALRVRLDQVADARARWDDVAGWPLSDGTWVPSLAPDCDKEAVRIHALASAEYAQGIADAARTYPPAPGETFEHQASDNGGKTWRTVAVGLEASDVAAIRAGNPGTEGTNFRFVADGPARPVTMPLHMSGVRVGDRISGFPGVPGVLTVTEAWWHSPTLTHRFHFAETGDQLHQVDRDGAGEVALHERPDMGSLDAVYAVGDAVRFRFGIDRDRDQYGVVTEVIEHPGIPTGYEISGGPGSYGAACGVENMAPLNTPKREVGQTWKSDTTGREVTITELEDPWGVIVRTIECGSVILLRGWTLVEAAPTEAAVAVAVQELPAPREVAYVSPWATV